MRDLRENLDAGSDWDEAYGKYWLALTGHRRREWPPGDGRVNWTWLTDLVRFDRVVDLGSPFAEVAASLATGCDGVSYIGRDSAHGVLVQKRLAGHLPGVRFESTGTGWRPQAEHDLVAFIAATGWRDRVPEGISTLRAVIKMAQGLLRPGGWLGILSPNPLWYHQLRLGSTSLRRHLADSYRLRSLRRRLLAAGFVDCREYFATATNLIPHGTPMASLDLSLTYIPNRRETLASCLAVAGVRGWRARLVELGLGGVLFPVRLMLARR